MSPIDFKDSERRARAAAREALERVELLIEAGQKRVAEKDLLAGYCELGRALAFAVTVPPRENEDLPHLLEHIGDGWLGLVIQRLLLGDLKDVELHGYTKFLRSQLDVVPTALAGR